MKSFAIAAFAAFASLAISAPTNEPIEKRANSGLEICVNVGFGGACAHLVNPFGDCINFDSDFNDKVSSVGPDKGSECYLYNNYGCSGEVLSELVYPGFSDLTSVYGGDFNDALSSYYCVAN